jgi:hypothetical protein
MGETILLEALEPIEMSQLEVSLSMWDSLFLIVSIYGFVVVSK